MNELNATATQLAIDNSYYDNKAQECFELMTQLNDWADTEPCQVTFAVSVNDRQITVLPTPLKAWTTIMNALNGFYTYYKEKALQAREGLSAIQSVGGASMPF